MSDLDYSTYLSPFTWRYGSEQMRQIFSEENKYKTWRKIWVALAKAEYKADLLTKKELDDLKANQDKIDIKRILEIEEETKHDVVAAIREFAEKAKIGGGKIHLGATSQDVGDNAEIIRNKQALEMIEERSLINLKLFSEKINKYANFPCMGYTHLQPAEPTTLGYRFAFYAQDLLTDLKFLRFVKNEIKGKGIKGAVGTAASYKNLLTDKNLTPAELEKIFLKNLGIEAVEIATQVYPRKFDFLVLACLSSIASTIAKFAFDLRIMQSPGFGEWQEPFGKLQVGSSAMPFKRNPFTSEKICSIARYVNFLPAIALENAAASLLERTLDDSANKRVIMPEAFLAVDDILITSQKLLEGLVINEKRIKFNLNQYAPFSATELIIIAAVKKGADRQKMHELLREISMNAYEQINLTGVNPMKEILIINSELKKYFEKDEIIELLNIENHIGDAPKRALTLVKQIAKLT